jgi:hypothetical protein
VRGRKGTGPHGLIAKGRGHKQIAARVRREHVEELYRMLAQEKVSFNRFVELCVEAYIRSDPRMRGLVEADRRNAQIPKREKREKRFSFDERERQELLREIESLGPEVDE